MMKGEQSTITKLFSDIHRYVCLHICIHNTHTQRTERAKERDVLIGRFRPVAADFRTEVLNKNTSVVDTVRRKS